jgi:hypothetical protein
MRKSADYRFAGMNIKGTPAMSARAVAHDLKVMKSRADLAVFQEFRWKWYWAQLALVLNPRWGTFPTMHLGRKHPVRGAQAALWKKKYFKRIETRRSLLHDGVAKVSESRYITAVLLEDRKSMHRFWIVSTHYVVRGDNQTDPKIRQVMFHRDVSTTGAFLNRLQKTGQPIIMELDANVRPSSSHYGAFVRMIESRGGRMHGTKGVEFLVTFPGKHSRIQVIRDWVIPTSELKTDHEGRGITFRLV